jgi:fibronectin-binding autotransporter adhesin
MTRTNRYFRPRLEALDRRDVPASLLVTTAADDAFDPGSLRAEIAAAQSGDTINFDGSLSGSTIYLTGPELRIPDKTLTIDASNLAGGVAISGQGGVRVFQIGAAAHVTLNGLTMFGGNGTAHGGGWFPDPDDGLGGGILNRGTLTLNGCSVDNSTALQGGGIWNDGTLTISRVTVSMNSAIGDINSFDGGGGIWNDRILKATACTFDHNSANGWGGAVWNTGSLSLTGLVWQNSARHDGGGVYNVGGAMAISGGSILDNTAGGNGGGIYTRSTAKVTVSGVTFTGNSATFDGGGICNEGSLLVTGNTALHANTAYAGGGIYNAAKSKLTIKNSVVTDNYTTTVGADLFNLGHVSVSGSTIGDRYDG